MLQRTEEKDIVNEVRKRSGAGSVMWRGEETIILLGSDKLRWREGGELVDLETLGRELRRCLKAQRGLTLSK